MFQCLLALSVVYGFIHGGDCCQILPNTSDLSGFANTLYLRKLTKAQISVVAFASLSEVYAQQSKAVVSVQDIASRVCVCLWSSLVLCLSPDSTSVPSVRLA